LKLLEDKKYYTKESQFYFIFKETSPNFYKLIVQNKFKGNDFLWNVTLHNKNLFIIALPVNIIIFNIGKKVVFNHQNLLIYDSHNDVLEYFEPFGKLKFTKCVWKYLQKFFINHPKLIYDSMCVQKENSSVNLECTNINIIYAIRRSKIIKSYANDMDLINLTNYALMIKNIKELLTNILYSPYSGILSGGDTDEHLKKKYKKYKQKYINLTKK